MSLAAFKFMSQFLHQNEEISLILPDIARTDNPGRFYLSGRKYPVIWLLHGEGGDNSIWWRRSRIEMYATERNVAVVMPSLHNSCYQNYTGLGMGTDTYDFITRELMTIVPAWFPVSDQPEDNYIFGLSMGSAGAVSISAGNPEKFAGAAVIAGLESDYGSWELLKECGDKMPPLYCAYASGNRNFTQNYEQMQEYAQENGLNAEFSVVEEFGNEWRFYDRAFEMAMDHFEMRNVDAGNIF